MVYIIIKIFTESGALNLSQVVEIDQSLKSVDLNQFDKVEVVEKI